MSSATESALVIEGISADIEADLQDAITDFRQSGLDCKFHYRQPVPQAALEWFMATAVLIWLGDKYFGSIFEEMGKDHYQLLKQGLRALYDKTLGPNASIKCVIRQVNGKIRPDVAFSGNLSYTYRAHEGWRIKLLFPLDVNFEQYERSCSRFSSLIWQYLHQPTNSPLNDEIDSHAREGNPSLPPEVAASMRPYVTLLIFWDDATQAFRVADPVASSRTSSLVSWPLGQERSQETPFE